MICTCCCETWCIVKRNKSLSKLGITEYFRYKNRMKIVDLTWPQPVGEGGIVFLTWYFDHLRIINFIWAVEEWSASLRPVSDHHPPPPTRLSSHLPPTATTITPYCHKIGGNRLAIDKVFTKVDRSKWKIPELPKNSLQPHPSCLKLINLNDFIVRVRKTGLIRTQKRWSCFQCATEFYLQKLVFPFLFKTLR